MGGELWEAIGGEGFVVGVLGWEVEGEGEFVVSAAEGVAEGVELFGGGWWEGVGIDEELGVGAGGSYFGGGELVDGAESLDGGEIF